MKMLNPLKLVAFEPAPLKLLTMRSIHSVDRVSRIGIGVALVLSVFLPACLASDFPASGKKAPKESPRIVAAELMPQMTVTSQPLAISLASATADLPNEQVNAALEMRRPWAMAPSDFSGVRCEPSLEYMPYYGRLKEAARYDINVAQRAGVNTFALLFGVSSMDEKKSRYAKVAHAYFQAAPEFKDFMLFPDIWADLDPKSLDLLADGLGEIAEKYDNVWRRYKGRRVLRLMMVDPLVKNQLPPYKETMDRLLKKVGGRDAIFLVLLAPTSTKLDGYGKRPIPEDWARGADAFMNWAGSSSYGDQAVVMPQGARDAEALGKEYFESINPSFQQARPFLKRPPIVKEALGIMNFMDGWKMAINRGSGMVVVATWNDLTEDSGMMPTKNHGDAYCDLNRYFAKQYQSKAAPPIEQEQILLFHHPQTVSNVKLPEGYDAPKSYSWLATPPTDFVAVVGFFKEPTKLIVHIGTQVTATKEFRPGMESWLIYHPTDMATIRDQEPDKQVYAKKEAFYPKESGNLSITTVAAPFQDAEVYVEAFRNDARVALYRSKQPILGADRWGDLSTSGEIFNYPPSAAFFAQPSH